MRHEPLIEKAARPPLRWAALAAVLVLALAVRLAFLLGMEAYPRFEHIKNRLDDQVFLDGWAKSIVNGTPLDLADSPHEFAYWAARRPGVFPQAPLYAYFLAATYRLFGFRYDAVRAIQLLLGTVAVMLIYASGRLLFGTAAGLFAALGAALYRPFVFYEATFLIDSLTVFFAALIVYLLVRLDTRASPASGHAVIAGLVLGCASLLRPNFLLVALVAAAWLARRGRTRRAGVWLLLAALAFISPVIVHNTVRSGSPAFIASNAPFNLYIGNVHDAPGNVPTTTPTYLHAKERSLSEPISLVRELRADIAAYPARFAYLQITKLAFFFGGYEIPNNLNYYVARRCNPALALAVLDYSLVLPLAAIGIVLTLARRTAAMPLLFLVTYTLSVTAFFVVSRLRQPALVPLLLFAGYGASRCLDWLRHGRVVVALVVVVVTIAGALWLRPGPDGLVRWTDWAMAGVSYRGVAQEHERGGALAAARDAYVRAVVLNPADHTAAARLAALPVPDIAVAPETQRAAVQRCEEARALAEAKNYAAAQRTLADAIRLAPQLAMPYQYLANVRLLAGDRPGAIDALEDALARAPTNAVFRHNLEVLKGFVAE